jgi:hypothetical protein
MDVFTCSIILLLITILLLMWSVPLNAIVLVLLIEIVNLYFGIIFYSLCTDFCIKVSDSVISTWSSAKRRVFISLFLFICIPFILSVFHSKYVKAALYFQQYIWHTPLLIYTDCVILLFSLIFISLCSCIFISAESRESGMFLFCSILNSVGQFTWLNPFS